MKDVLNNKETQNYVFWACAQKLLREACFTKTWSSIKSQWRATVFLPLEDFMVQKCMNKNINQEYGGSRGRIKRNRRQKCYRYVCWKHLCDRQFRKNCCIMVSIAWRAVPHFSSQILPKILCLFTKAQKTSQNAEEALLVTDPSQSLFMDITAWRTPVNSVGNGHNASCKQSFYGLLLIQWNLVSGAVWTTSIRGQDMSSLSFPKHSWKGGLLQALRQPPRSSELFKAGSCFTK